MSTREEEGKLLESREKVNYDYDDSAMKGWVRLYASHTPCISCVAACCAFRGAHPGVSLAVDFDPWAVVRERALKEAAEADEEKRVDS